jgi:hypothetical protein
MNEFLVRKTIYCLQLKYELGLTCRTDNEQLAAVKISSTPFARVGENSDVALEYGLLR